VFALVRLLRDQFPADRLEVALPAGGVFAERFRNLGVAVHEFPFDTISPAGALAFSAFLNRQSPDVVHSHGKGAGLYARFRRRPAARRVHSYHGFHPPSGPARRWLYLKLEGMLLDHTALVINVSQSEHDDLARIFPSCARKLRVVPNVVDPADILQRSQESLPSKLKESLLRHQGGFVVTMIARNDPVKNYPLALDTLRLLLAEERDVSAVVVGAEEDYPPLRQLASDFPGRLLSYSSLSNTAPLLAASSILLMTSRKEGAPLVAMEAACLGIPVVGTDVEGIRDVVLHESNGLLSAASAQLLAAAVRRLRRDAPLYERLREGALARCRRFDARAWAASYRAIYAEGVGR
jgi:glycosyltransferase involved in cell wall biosynthesis